MKTKPLWMVSIFVAALALCIAAASTPRATLAGPLPPDHGSKFELEGKITEATTNKLTISTDENMIFHVTYFNHTLIQRRDGTSGTAKDLTTGEKVKVDGTLTPAGIIEADTIEIE